VPYSTWLIHPNVPFLNGEIVTADLVSTGDIWNASLEITEAVANGKTYHLENCVVKDGFQGFKITNPGVKNLVISQYPAGGFTCASKTFVH